VWVVAALGTIWILGGFYAWALEPATAPEEPELETPDTESSHEHAAVSAPGSHE